jgi:DNA-directed RNA polymerase subunit M
LEFCPNCEKRLIYTPDKGYQCPKCGYTTNAQRLDASSEQIAITEKVTSPILVRDQEETILQTLPTITVNCPKCNNSKAVYWTHAVGTDDDVELLQLFRCTHCGHRWRQEE